jgi:hypothetical protein
MQLDYYIVTTIACTLFYTLLYCAVFLVKIRFYVFGSIGIAICLTIVVAGNGAWGPVLVIMFAWVAIIMVLVAMGIMFAFKTMIAALHGPAPKNFAGIFRLLFAISPPFVLVLNIINLFNYASMDGNVLQVFF